MVDSVVQTLYGDNMADGVCCGDAWQTMLVMHGDIWS